MVTNAAKDAIGMTGFVGAQRAPTAAQPVRWDMCYLSENKVTQTTAAASEFGCRLNLVNVAGAPQWELKGDTGANTNIRCEVFCVKMIFE